MLEAADIIIAVPKETVRRFYNVTKFTAAHSYFITRLYIPRIPCEVQAVAKETGIRLELGRHVGETVLRDWEVAEKGAR